MLIDDESETMMHHTQKKTGGRLCEKSFLGYFEKMILILLLLLNMIFMIRRKEITAVIASQIMRPKSTSSSYQPN